MAGLAGNHIAKLLQVPRLVSLSHIRVPTRCLATTPACQKNRRSGVPKVTPNRSKALTYEEAQRPEHIGVRKAWNSWNTSNLHEEDEHTSVTTTDDMFIRRFVAGTWHGLFASDIIIKRRANMIIISGVVTQAIAARKMYFLLGYTEDLLSAYLKQPVRMEIQTINRKRDIYYKFI